MSSTEGATTAGSAGPVERIGRMAGLIEKSAAANEALGQLVGGCHLLGLLKNFQRLTAFARGDREHLWHGLPRQAEGLVVYRFGACLE